MTNRRNIMIGLLLAALCAIIYGQTLTFEFLHYDDDRFITENPDLWTGLSWHGLVWAFTTNRESYYIPITWVTHLFDCQVYGLQPWGHHLTSLIFHAVNCVLLFAVLLRMTRRTWPSALAAALFAVHPLHVESVAWVSERKDLVSAFLLLLTLDAYTRYVERLRSAAAGIRSRVESYILVFQLFIVGLMAKPLLLTLPGILLLLDYWPLGRVRSRRTDLRAVAGRCTRLVIEKLPFIVVALVFSLITANLLHRGVHLVPAESGDLRTRLGGAVVAYVRYLMNTICPIGLAVPYPMRVAPLWQVVYGLVLLAGITAVVLYYGRRRPYLPMGWFWYLGILFPLIGLVQPTGFSYSDRYMHVPILGLFIIVAWGIADLSALLPGRTRYLPAAVAVAAIAALTGIAVVQTSYWSDTLTLFQHALNSTSNNAKAHYAVANEYIRLGRKEEAETHLREALAIRPGFRDARTNYAQLLSELGRNDEAVLEYEKAMRTDPTWPQGHADLAIALVKLGLMDNAILECAEALALDPHCAKAHNALAVALTDRGRYDEALDHYRESIRDDPAYGTVHFNLGTLLANLGRTDEAVRELSEAIRLSPLNGKARFNLAGVLMEQGRRNEAIDQYRRLVVLEPRNLDACVNLGAAMAGGQRFEDAVRCFEKALEIDPDCSKARAGLAGALAALGRSEEARQLLDAVPGKEPSTHGGAKN